MPTQKRADSHLHAHIEWNNWWSSLHVFAYVNDASIKSSHGIMPHFVLLLKWGCNQWWTHKPGHVWRLMTLQRKNMSHIHILRNSDKALVRRQNQVTVLVSLAQESYLSLSFVSSLSPALSLGSVCPIYNISSNGFYLSYKKEFSTRKHSLIAASDFDPPTLNT